MLAATQALRKTAIPHPRRRAAQQIARSIAPAAFDPNSTLPPQVPLPARIVAARTGISHAQLNADAMRRRSYTPLTATAAVATAAQADATTVDVNLHLSSLHAVPAGEVRRRLLDGKRPVVDSDDGDDVHEVFRRRAAFTSRTILPHVCRHWAVVFTTASQEQKNAQVRRYFDWYATRVKFLYLDRMEHGAALQRDLYASFAERDLRAMGWATEARLEAAAALKRRERRQRAALRAEQLPDGTLSGASSPSPLPSTFTETRASATTSADAGAASASEVALSSQPPVLQEPRRRRHLGAAMRPISMMQEAAAMAAEEEAAAHAEQHGRHSQPLHHDADEDVEEPMFDPERAARAQRIRAKCQEVLQYLGPRAFDAPLSEATCGNLTHLPLPPLDLPTIFVGGQLLGSLDTLHALESSSRLKDALQFGFLWHTRGDAAVDLPPSAMVAPAAAYGDEQFFHGAYRGVPLVAPVTKLHKFSSRPSIDEMMEDAVRPITPE